MWPASAPAACSPSRAWWARRAIASPCSTPITTCATSRCRKWSTRCALRSVTGGSGVRRKLRRLTSYYQQLGVPRSASTEEIRVAYRELARRLHPDHQVNATAAERALAERRMREINQAWQTLRDPATRRAYDLDRRADAPAAPPPGRTGPARGLAGEDRDDCKGGALGPLGPPPGPR